MSSILSKLINLAGNITGILAVTNGGTGVATSTGTTNTVLSNGPTLVAPLLGTPASGNLSNCTNYPAATASTAGTITKEATGSFTATFGGVSGTITDTWFYALSGNVVIINPGANTKQFTKNGTPGVVTVTGLPAAIIPTTTVNTSGWSLSYNDSGSPTSFPLSTLQATTSGLSGYRSSAQDTFAGGTQNTLVSTTITYVLR